MGVTHEHTRHRDDNVVRCRARRPDRAVGLQDLRLTVAR